MFEYNDDDGTNNNTVDYDNSNNNHNRTTKTMMRGEGGLCESTLEEYPGSLIFL